MLIFAEVRSVIVVMPTVMSVLSKPVIVIVISVVRIIVRSAAAEVRTGRPNLVVTPTIVIGVVIIRLEIGPISLGVSRFEFLGGGVFVLWGKWPDL